MTIPPDDDALTIQELARLSGLNESTLRYYEKIGLLNDIPRDASSGHRRYPIDMVKLVNALSCLRASGLSIEDMRTYLRLLQKGKKGAAEQRALFAAHVEDLDRQIERLQTRKAYIAAKVAYWDAIERGDDEEVQRILEANYRIAEELRAQHKENKA